MTGADVRALPSLIDLAASMYAQGQLDGTKTGDRWVGVAAFADQAVREGLFGTLALRRLYDRMLTEGSFVFGGSVPGGEPA
jgi:hypothetical protein